MGTPHSLDPFLPDTVTYDDTLEVWHYDGPNNETHRYKLPEMTLLMLGQAALDAAAEELSCAS